MTGRVKDMIVDPTQTGRLQEVISEGEFYGMQTFDQALLKHLQAGRVSMRDAMRAATTPHDFKLLVAAEGRTATSMEDLSDATNVPQAAGPVTLKRPGPPIPPGPGSSRQGSTAPPPGVAA
jgi:twitching motility protein PilT